MKSIEFHLPILDGTPYGHFLDYARERGIILGWTWHPDLGRTMEITLYLSDSYESPQDRNKRLRRERHLRVLGQLFK